MSGDSELLKKVKNPYFWDQIFMAPIPRSRQVREGFRINIELEKEEDIEDIKKFLRKFYIFFEDRKATSFSGTVAPGDRTLRVIQNASVANLKKMWNKEFEKSPLG